MDKLDEFMKMIQKKHVIESTEALLNQKGLTGCSKTYLSSMLIVYFPSFFLGDQFENNQLYNTGVELLGSDNESIGRHMEQFSAALQDWKQIDIANNIQDINYMSQQLSERLDHIKDPELNRCFRIQDKILEHAKDYFENAKDA